MAELLIAHLALRSVEFPELLVALAVLWLMIIGGSIGSFLNVVVYRLPQGLSLVRPGSHCPRCGTPILARDNLPIIGWLKLRGRCRACHCFISPRYPIVELVCALILVALAAAELGGGWSLPMPRQSAAGAIYPLWEILPFHFVLMCGLLAAALIAYDDEGVPKSLWLTIWLIGFLAPIALPRLRPIGVPPIDDGWQLALVGLLGGLAGTAAGVALGAASWPAATVGSRGRSGHLAGVAAGAVVGTFLGWQAASVILLLTCAVWSAWQVVRLLVSTRFDLPWLMFLAVVVMAWLMAWRPIVETWPALGTEAGWYLPPVAAIATLIVAVAGRVPVDALRRRFT